MLAIPMNNKEKQIAFKNNLFESPTELLKKIAKMNNKNENKPNIPLSSSMSKYTLCALSICLVRDVF